MRPRKDHDREAIKGSLSPAADLSGGISDGVVTPNLDNMASRVAKLTDEFKGKTVVVVGDGEPYVRDAIRALRVTIGEEVAEMQGGQVAWLKYYTPRGSPDQGTSAMARTTRRRSGQPRTKISELRDTHR